MSPFKKFRKKFKQSLSRFIYSLADGKPAKEVKIEEKTLVIVKNDFIGDYILFRNFLPYIKKSEKYKDYKIIMIGNANWKQLAESLDGEYYDEIIWIAYNKLYKNLRYRSGIMKTILSRGFDTLFYPVYTGDHYTENFFIDKIIAREKIKFSPESLEKQMDIKPFSSLLPTNYPNLFEIYRYKEMFEVFFKVSIPTFQWRSLVANNYHYQQVPQHAYVVFFPGSSAYLKRWHTSNFVVVANHLVKKYNYKIVLAGSKKDNKYANAIMKGVDQSVRSSIIDVTGKTSLLELSHLISHSELLVTNDSVAIHMAASVGKEAVCVFMGENYGRFAPYPKEIYSRGVYICPPDVEALVKNSNTKDTFLSLSYNPKLNAIKPHKVIEAIDSILSK